MTTFMSLFTKHIIPKILPPTKETLVKKYEIHPEPLNRDKRNMPYPPNFNNTPAKIIEPVTGASTCALGSQRCTKYIGNLTKNAKIINNLYSGGIARPMVKIEIVLTLLFIDSMFNNTIIINKGSEAKRV